MSYKSIGLLSIVLLLSACSAVGPHTPVLAVNSAEIPTFLVNGDVSVDNAQTDTTAVDLDFRGVIINLNESTQVLVDALSNELRSHAATTTATDGKTLSVSVTHIEMRRGFNVYSAKVKISVVLGSGESVAIETSRKSLASGYNLSSNPTKPLDVAMSDAVKEILTNPVVLSYLGN